MSTFSRDPGIGIGDFDLRVRDGKTASILHGPTNLGDLRRLRPEIQAAGEKDHNGGEDFHKDRPTTTNPAPLAGWPPLVRVPP